RRRVPGPMERGRSEPMPGARGKVRGAGRVRTGKSTVRGGMVAPAGEDVDGSATAARARRVDDEWWWRGSTSGAPSPQARRRDLRREPAGGGPARIARKRNRRPSAPDVESLGDAGARTAPALSRPPSA